MGNANDKLILTDEDDNEVVIPSKYEVCPRCDGRGVHDHPAFANGISAEDWEHDWDEESRESYLNGGYDVVCTECKGVRVVLVPDLYACNEKQRSIVEAHEQSMAELRAAERSERFMHGDY